jgi:hypothetical protein
MKNTEPETPDLQYNWAAGDDPTTDKEIKAYFFSPEIKSLKVLMCDIGRCMWQRGFVDGNRFRRGGCGAGTVSHARKRAVHR